MLESINSIIKNKRNDVFIKKVKVIACYESKAFTISSDTMTLILNADSWPKTRNQLRQMRLDNKGEADKC